MARGPYTFVIRGRPVSQKNSKRIFRSAEGKPFISSNQGVKDWMRDAVIQLQNQYLGQKCFECEVEVQILAILDKGQRGDVDNLATAPLDALQKAKVIKNDSLVRRLVIEKARDPDWPRLHIHVKPLGSQSGIRTVPLDGFG